MKGVATIIRGNTHTREITDHSVAIILPPLYNLTSIFKFMTWGLLETLINTIHLMAVPPLVRQIVNHS